MQYIILYYTVYSVTLILWLYILYLSLSHLYYLECGLWRHPSDPRRHPHRSGHIHLPVHHPARLRHQQRDGHLPREEEARQDAGHRGAQADAELPAGAGPRAGRAQGHLHPGGAGAAGHTQQRERHRTMAQGKD